MNTSALAAGSPAAAVASPKLLFVDDDPNLLAAFGRTFRNQFEFDTALGGAEALKLVQTTHYAVVVADMTMPVMNGIELLEQIRVASPDTVGLMLTGNADQSTAVESINRGQIFRFLNKPCSFETLSAAVGEALRHYEMRRAERELLEGTLTGSVKLLTDILGMMAPDALGRGQRLRLCVGHFARQRAVAVPWECELAALLSSIGFAAVPPSVMEKQASAEPLSLVEESILRRVPQIGHDLLADIPRFRGVAQAVLYQGKNYDGSGFPGDATAGEAIPAAARLLRIFADRLELENDGVVKERALATMQQRAGHYDPVLLEECFKVFPTFLPNALAGNRPVLSLVVDDLVVGHVTVSEICTNEGLAIVGAGHVLTSAIIERIRNFAELGDVREPVLVQETGAADALQVPAVSAA